MNQTENILVQPQFVGFFPLPLQTKHPDSKELLADWEFPHGRIAALIKSDLMPANNKYISNDTTRRYALSYFVCSEGTSNEAARGRREKSGRLPLQELCPLWLLLGKPGRKQASQ